MEVQVSADVDEVDVLVELIKKEKDSDVKDVPAILSSFTKLQDLLSAGSADRQLKLCSLELGLIHILVFYLTCLDNMELSVLASTIIWKLSDHDTNKLTLLNYEGFMDTLHNLLICEHKELKANGVNILWYLSRADATKEKFCQQFPNLLLEMVKLLKLDTSVEENKMNANNVLKVLTNIATKNRANRNVLSAEDFGLLKHYLYNSFSNGVKHENVPETTKLFLEELVKSDANTKLATKYLCEVVENLSSHTSSEVQLSGWKLLEHVPTFVPHKCLPSPFMKTLLKSFLQTISNLQVTMEVKTAAFNAMSAHLNSNYPSTHSTKWYCVNTDAILIATIQVIDNCHVENKDSAIIALNFFNSYHTTTGLHRISIAIQTQLFAMLTKLLYSDEEKLIKLALSTVLKFVSHITYGKDFFQKQNEFCLKFPDVIVAVLKCLQVTVTTTPAVTVTEVSSGTDSITLATTTYPYAADISTLLQSLLKHDENAKYLSSSECALFGICANNILNGGKLFSASPTSMIDELIKTNPDNSQVLTEKVKAAIELAMQNKDTEMQVLFDMQYVTVLSPPILLAFDRLVVVLTERLNSDDVNLKLSTVTALKTVVSGTTVSSEVKTKLWDSSTGLLQLLVNNLLVSVDLTAQLMELFTLQSIGNEVTFGVLLTLWNSDVKHTEYVLNSLTSLLTPSTSESFCRDHSQLTLKVCEIVLKGDLEFVSKAMNILMILWDYKSNDEILLQRYNTLAIVTNDRLKGSSNSLLTVDRFKIVLNRLCGFSVDNHQLIVDLVKGEISTHEGETIEKRVRTLVNLSEFAELVPSVKIVADTMIELILSTFKIDTEENKLILCNTFLEQLQSISSAFKLQLLKSERGVLKLFVNNLICENEQLTTSILKIIVDLSARGDICASLIYPELVLMSTLQKVLCATQSSTFESNKSAIFTIFYNIFVENRNYCNTFRNSHNEIIAELCKYLSDNTVVSIIAKLSGLEANCEVLSRSELGVIAHFTKIIIVKTCADSSTIINNLVRLQPENNSTVINVVEAAVSELNNETLEIQFTKLVAMQNVLFLTVPVIVLSNAIIGLIKSHLAADKVDEVAKIDCFKVIIKELTVMSSDLRKTVFSYDNGVLFPTLFMHMQSENVELRDIALKCVDEICLNTLIETFPCEAFVTATVSTEATTDTSAAQKINLYGSVSELFTKNYTIANNKTLSLEDQTKHDAFIVALLRLLYKIVCTVNGSVDFYKNNTALYSEIVLALQNSVSDGKIIKSTESALVYDILGKLVQDQSNMVLMLQDERDLLKSMIHYIMNSPQSQLNSHKQDFCDNVLVKIFETETKYKEVFVNYISTELTALIGDCEKLNNAFVTVQNFILTPSIGAVIGEHDNNIIATIVEALEKYPDHATNDKHCDLHENAWTLVWYVVYYCNIERRVSVCAPETRLIARFVDAVNNRAESRIIQAAVNGIFNLGMSDACAPNLGYSEIKLIAALFESLKYYNNSIRSSSINIIRCIVKADNPLYTIDAVACGVHLVGLEALVCDGPSEKMWMGTLKLDWLMMLTYMSMCEEGAAALKAAGALDVFFPILNAETNRDTTQAQALFLIAFLMGKDEQKVVKTDTTSEGMAVESAETASTEQKMVVKPEHIAALKTVFGDIIAGSGIFGNGSYSLRLILTAFLTLSISDSNKVMLVADTVLLNYLKKVLEKFRDNEPEIRFVGGGGKDFKAAGTAIECLLNMSFAFEENTDLQTKFMTPDSGILALLEALADNTTLTTEAHRLRTALVSRLKPIEIPTVEEIEKNMLMDTTATFHSNAVKRTHVMLSYCWRQDAKPHHVKQLGYLLKDHGYEVWRDEDGSSLVSKMEGETDDRMAEAIEASSHVIVCVSKGYKESANCRMEAKYTNQLFKKKKVNVIYVMMQADYTTVSEPESCDGWLGIMLGDALWYPLFHEDHLTHTVKALCGILGEQSKQQQMALPSPVKSAPPQQQLVPTTPTPSAVVVKPVDYTEAYHLLTKPSHSSADHHATIMALLTDEFGVESPEDLSVLEPEHIIQLAKLLKVVPRTRFATMMNVIVPK